MPDGPEEPPFLEQVAKVMHAAGQRLVQFVEETRPAVQRLATGIDDRVAPFRKWVAQHGPELLAAGAALVKLSAESHIENWETLDQEQWLRALGLMTADDGVPLAWLPPAEVVEQLVDAQDHSARDLVLLANEADIQRDARRLLSAVTDPGLAELRQATEQAWDAWEAGLLVPAQAAAAAIVGEVLLRYGHDDFASFRIEWEQFRDVRVEDWKLTELRTTAVMCALSTAVQREDQGTFPGFNRHITAHRLDPAQHTRANALRGLMLVTAAVRELQFRDTDEWLQSPRLRPPRPTGRTPEQTLADAEAFRERAEQLGAVPPRSKPPHPNAPESSSPETQPGAPD